MFHIISLDLSYNQNNRYFGLNHYLILENRRLCNCFQNGRCRSCLGNCDRTGNQLCADHHKADNCQGLLQAPDQENEVNPDNRIPAGVLIMRSRGEGVSDLIRKRITSCVFY